MYPIIKKLYILMVTKQSYIYSSFYVVFLFSLFLQYCVKNVFKHIFLNMHEIQIIMEDISDTTEELMSSPKCRTYVFKLLI